MWCHVQRSQGIKKLLKLWKYSEIAWFNRNMYTILIWIAQKTSQPNIAKLKVDKVQKMDVLLGVLSRRRNWVANPSSRLLCGRSRTNNFRPTNGCPFSRSFTWRQRIRTAYLYTPATIFLMVLCGLIYFQRNTSKKLVFFKKILVKLLFTKVKYAWKT